MENQAKKLEGYVTRSQVIEAGGKWDKKLGLFIFSDGSAGCFLNGRGSKFFENRRAIDGKVIK